MGTIEYLYQIFLRSTGVSTDSRNIKKGNIFFALKGENFNGNKYAAKALEKGAALAVIEEEEFDGENTFLVDDVLFCLQALARHHRTQFEIPVIALTGTNGKTTTKELIREVLARKYHTLATTGNLNNHIGVPLTLLGLVSETEIGVIEMGANHRGEIAQLCDIAQPTHGMITNIGKAHLEGFGGYEGVMAAKSEIFTYLKETGGLAFVNKDDEVLMGLSDGMKTFTYGSSKKADIQARISASVPFLGLKWGDHHIPTQMYGDYNFQNALAAICIGSYFKVAAGEIVEAVASYTPSNNRSQVVRSESNTIYLDAYNANPTSMLLSLRQFRHQEGKNKAVILGDMLELGKDSLKEHREIIKELRKDFTTVILVGPEFIKAIEDDPFHVFADTDEAGNWLSSNPVADASVLVKGSRGIALEKLLEYL
jgi:UDP-N-acetylmuramoyl-tripeptide--D-alanyl-D-alanine ligase